jgi:hypothetical protein
MPSRRQKLHECISMKVPVRFAVACHGESFDAMCKEVVGKRLAVGECQDVVNVTAKNDDAAFVRAVFVDAITFWYIW